MFRNPPGDSAGRLIDASGLKGLRVGAAVVSPKHANFFQAEPGAAADDAELERISQVVFVRKQDGVARPDWDAELDTLAEGGAIDAPQDDDRAYSGSV